MGLILYNLTASEQRLPYFGILALFNCVSQNIKGHLYCAVYTANTLKLKQNLKRASDPVRNNINFEKQIFMCVGLHSICLAGSILAHCNKTLPNKGNKTINECYLQQLDC